MFSPGAEVRAALLCGNSHLAVPPHPCPPVSESPPGVVACPPWGFQLEIFVLQPRCVEQHWGLCFGRADLAGPAVRNSRAPAPLPAPCPADLVLTPQLTSWLLYIYFSPCPPCSLLSPCLSQKQQRCRDWQLEQAPAKNAGLTLRCTPRNTPCGHPGERDRLHSHPKQ